MDTQINYWVAPGLPTAGVVNNSNVNFIINLVANTTGIPYEKMRLKSRKREVCTARTMSIYLINKHLESSLLTFESIGGIFGKDHSTVSHIKKNYGGVIEYDKMLNKMVREIEAKILLKLNKDV